MRSSDIIKECSKPQAIPGSKRMSRLAPIKFIPHPPALLLNRKMNSFLAGSLNWSTSFWRLVMLMLPSRRKQPYLKDAAFNEDVDRGMIINALFATAELLEEVKGLGIIADENNLVRRICVYVM